MGSSSELFCQIDCRATRFANGKSTFEQLNCYAEPDSKNLKFKKSA